MLHPIFGTNFLSSFVGLIFQISHLHPHLVQLMSFHLFTFLLSITLSHKTQNSPVSKIMSALVCFWPPDCFHEFMDVHCRFYTLVSFVNSLF